MYTVRGVLRTSNQLGHDDGTCLFYPLPSARQYGMPPLCNDAPHTTHTFLLLFCSSRLFLHPATPPPLFFFFGCCWMEYHRDQGCRSFVPLCCVRFVAGWGRTCCCIPIPNAVHVFPLFLVRFDLTQNVSSPSFSFLFSFFLGSPSFAHCRPF